MKRLFVWLLVFASVCASVFSADAAAIDPEFEPKVEAEITAPFDSVVSFEASESEQACKTYSVATESGYALSAEFCRADDADEAVLAIRIFDSLGRRCSSEQAVIQETDRGLRCVLIPETSGKYYLELGCSGFDTAIECSVHITPFAMPELKIADRYPFTGSAVLTDRRIPMSDVNCDAYSFTASAGNAFSFCAAPEDGEIFAFAYFDFSGGQNVPAGRHSEFIYIPADEDGAVRYCGTVSDNAVITFFLFGNGVKYDVDADMLQHLDYVVRGISLPFDGKLDMTDAIAPFDEDRLKDFLQGFPKDSIDNSPVKFFKFTADANDVIKFSAYTEDLNDLRIIYTQNSLSAASGSAQTSLLGVRTEAKTKKTPQRTDSFLAASANGEYMLCYTKRRGVDWIYTSLDLGTVCSLPAGFEFKAEYTEGDVLSGLGTTALFQPDNGFDGDTKPEIRFITLTDDSGRRVFYGKDEEITLVTGKYTVGLIAGYGENDYLISLSGITVKPKPVVSGTSSKPPVNNNASPPRRGLSGWWIALIAIGGFCLSCALFLLIYRKPEAFESEK